VSGKGEEWHRLSSKTGKPTTSRRKHQKVTVVVKRADRYIWNSLEGRVKAGVYFFEQLTRYLRGHMLWPLGIHCSLTARHLPAFS